jgi:hypothetical protein
MEEEYIKYIDIKEIDDKLKEGIKLEDDERLYIKELLEAQLKSNEMINELTPFGHGFRELLVKVFYIVNGTSHKAILIDRSVPLQWMGIIFD